MKKSIYLIVIFLAVIVLIAIVLRGFSGEDGWLCVGGQWVKHGNPSSSIPISGCGEETKTEEATGTITDITDNSLTISDDSEKIQFMLATSTFLANSEGGTIDKSYLRPGFEVLVATIPRAGEQKTAKEIRIIKEPNILIYSPIPNEEVSLPFELVGEARVFENAFNYRVTDASGTILAENMAYANAPDTGMYGRFDIHVKFAKSSSDNGYIEVFDYSAKDGLEIDKVAVPIRFKPGVETMKVKVFFGSQKLNPEALDCSKVYARERTIPKTQAAAQAALEELLAGPDSIESREGYYSSINTGVKLKKITIEKGLAKADFDKMLELNVGGSCRVISIRSQITETLKQFSAVKKVLISIDGRTDDILQP
jgi:hypothetical protein